MNFIIYLKNTIYKTRVVVDLKAETMVSYAETRSRSSIDKDNDR